MLIEYVKKKKKKKHYRLLLEANQMKNSILSILEIIHICDAGFNGLDRCLLLLLFFGLHKSQLVIRFQPFNIGI